MANKRNHDSIWDACRKAQDADASRKARDAARARTAALNLGRFKQNESGQWVHRCPDCQQTVTLGITVNGDVRASSSGQTTCSTVPHIQQWLHAREWVSVMKGFRACKKPAAVATAGGAKRIVVSKNTTVAQIGASANSPVITSIRRGPGGRAEWLVSIEGVCTDTPMRDRKLRRYRRFCNIIKYRFGVTFDPMSRADWLCIVEPAIGGVSS